MIRRATKPVRTYLMGSKKKNTKGATAKQSENRRDGGRGLDVKMMNIDMTNVSLYNRYCETI
jgi:hypothetical protein